MKKLKKTLIKFFLGIAPLFFIMLTILVFALYHTYEKSQQTMYNNGLTEGANGKWELVKFFKVENFYDCYNSGN